MHDNDAITWFEIPVADLARATRFYETVLDLKLQREDGMGMPMMVFPFSQPGVGGCLMAASEAPAQATGGGPIVYLHARKGLDAALARVPAAGGRLIQPRTELPEGMGAFALVQDCEGNRVGLHGLA